MAAKLGKIVLMGSGELTATMVEVHKGLIAELRPPKQAVFLDTPAGFQLNAKQIAETAVQYFKTRIQHPLTVASFRSAEEISTYEAEKAFHVLRNADYILMGPGSPTYAVRQIEKSPIADIIQKQILAGGCLVAASAAALTVGRYTLPVYEIYKVGEDIHWVDGINILARFGFNLVVVPHWNNAEGGTHDTRRCFMGESRFQALEALLPKEMSIIGLDEHTACIIDLNAQQVAVKGIGRVIIKRPDNIQVFTKGDIFPADVLKGVSLHQKGIWINETGTDKGAEPKTIHSSFWEKIHALEKDFSIGIANRHTAMVTSALLELDRIIWQGQQNLESAENISEAREILRDKIVVLGTALDEMPDDEEACLAPLVNELLVLRDHFRKNKQFTEADALRDSLGQINIHIEDTPTGTRWRKRQP